MTVATGVATAQSLWKFVLALQHLVDDRVGDLTH